MNSSFLRRANEGLYSGEDAKKVRDDLADGNAGVEEFSVEQLRDLYDYDPSIKGTWKRLPKAFRVFVKIMAVFVVLSFVTVVGRIVVDLA